MSVKMVKWILDNKKKIYYDTSSSVRRQKKEYVRATGEGLEFIDIALATREQLLEFIKICIEYGNISSSNQI
jgi:c-di-GMP-binding flagellar brake protein YcgR